MTNKKPTGMWPHRLKDNPEEKRFINAWQKEDVLKYLLSPKDNNHPITPTDRDEMVAATVIQWLGSPVGQSFLEGLGYRKKKQYRSENDE